MRILIYYIVIIAFSFLYSCGTTGHIQFYNYEVSKDKIESEILKVINKDSLYTAPPTWNNYELGVDTVYDIFIMFQSNPKEIYQIDFVGPSSDWKISSTCILALVGVFNGKLWYFERDLSSEQKERVKRRFEQEILSKMKYTFSKE